MSRFLVYCLSFLTITQAFAVPTGVWDELMRSGAKGDDVFRRVGSTSHVADDITRSGVAGQTLIREIGSTSDVATHVRRVESMLHAILHQPDPVLLRKVATLAPQELEAALVLARGSRRLVEFAPDVASRGRLLHTGGADLIAAIGLHGDDLTREATKVDAWVAAGLLPPRVGEKMTLARFAEVMRTGTDGAWKFWRRYVEPHPKKWITAGTLTAYLANPEFFHDTVGNITEEGARRLIEIFGEAVSGGIRGAADGGQSTFNRIWKEFSARYLYDTDAWMAWLGLAVVCWVSGILLPRTRRLFIAPVAWLFCKSKH